MTTWTPESVEKMRRLYAEGLNVREISERMNKPANTVRRGLLVYAGGYKPRNTAWTPDRDEELKRRVEGGESARQISIVMGCSRHAEIGRCRRKGWQLKGSPEPRPKSTRPPRAPSAPRPRKLAAPVQKAVPRLSVMSKEPYTVGRPLLLRTGCRWPIAGESADTLFCDAADHDGTYCAHHRRMSVQPALGRYSDKAMYSAARKRA